MPQFLQDTFGLVYSSALLQPLLRIVFILIVALLMLKLIDSALKRIRSFIPPGDLIGLTRVRQRAETLRHIVRSVGHVVVSAILLFTVARELGFDLTSLLAGIGIAGIAIGFGAQSLVKDMIAGFFILLEDHYGVGDNVRIGQQEGVVEHMTLRLTVLRNFEGQLHVIPNGNIPTLTVLTRDWARAVVDITLSHKEELDPIFEILRRINTGLHRDMADSLLEEPQILGIERLSDDGVTIRLAVKTQPFKQSDVAREWRRRIKEAFGREGIEWPQKTTIIMGAPEEAGRPVRQ